MRMRSFTPAGITYQQLFFLKYAFDTDPQALRMHFSGSPQWSVPAPLHIRPQIQWTLRGYEGLTVLSHSI